MFTWTVAASLIVGAPALKDRRIPDKPPTGEWRIEQAEWDKRRPRCLAGDRVWIGARTIEIGSRMRLGVSKWSADFYRVNGECRADFTDPDRPDSPRERAIWKVEGDRLIICVGAPGEPRPTEYSARAYSGRMLFVLDGRISD